MMVTILTIIHLPEAPNPKVGPPTLHQPRTYTIVSFDPSAPPNLEPSTVYKNGQIR